MDWRVDIHQYYPPFFSSHQMIHDDRQPGQKYNILYPRTRFFTIILIRPNTVNSPL